MKRREVDLYPEHVKALLSTVEKMNRRDYLIIRLMAEQGFRIGEVVGSKGEFRERYCPQCKQPVTKTKRGHIILHLDCANCNKRWETPNELPSRWIVVEPNVKGLMIEDLHEDGIWVRGKGGTNKKQALAPSTVQALRDYIGRRTKGKIFDVRIMTVQRHLKRYAVQANLFGNALEARLIHPHRLRQFVGSELKERYDVKVAQDVLRHKTPVTTIQHYVRQTSIDKRREATKGLQDLIEPEKKEPEYFDGS